MANVRGGTACNILSFVPHSAHPSPIGHTGVLFSTEQWTHWEVAWKEELQCHMQQLWVVLYLGEDTSVLLLDRRFLQCEAMIQDLSQFSGYLRLVFGFISSFHLFYPDELVRL